MGFDDLPPDADGNEPDDGSLLPEQDESPAAGKQQRRRNRIILAVVAGTLCLVLVTVAAVIGLYVKSATDALSRVNRQTSMLPPSEAERPPSPIPAPGAQAPMNVLIMGTDSRGQDQGRSDVLMMAHVSGDRRSVYLISFPRDMWVDVPGRGKAKINAAYAWGGVPLSVLTVERLTGARISHSALIDFEGFISVLDLIGGVDVYNSVASSSGGFDFPKGMVHLDGKSGLVYTRQRYGLPNGDLDRARRQRDVVRAVVKKVLTPYVLANPGKFNEAITAMAPYFTVDDTFTNDEITKLAFSMRVGDGGGIRSLQAPIKGFGTSADGQSIDIVHTPYMTELGQALQGDKMEAYWEAHKDDPPVTER